MGGNTKQMQSTNVKNKYKKLSKEINSNKFCYLKVGSVITLKEAIEKFQQYYFNIEKFNNFRRL